MNTIKCNCNFDSSFAYIINNINDEPINKINISDYLSNNLLKTEISNMKKFLVCKNKNELIKYESFRKISHFKHKNSNGTTEWHKEWQTKLSEECKKYFGEHNNIIEIRIGKRVADAIIYENVIEFQHSYISINEVKQRGIDYLAYNKKIYWIIDCNDSIIYKEHGDIYLIKFIKDTWKYKNFISNEFIFLNIDNKLFKINPSLVKSNMIDVREYNLDDKFINSLINNINIWNNSEIIQCILYHNQRGAGCGKTYESIQLLNQNEIFKDKNIFIYLTKAHSAKEVIYNELEDQEKRESLENIKIYNKEELISEKKYKISYLNKITNTESTIYIGTIDSFMYAIGNKDIRHNDYFAGIVKSIKDGYVNTTTDGTIKYSSNNIKLNKQCLIIIDEAQDLDPDYIEAICSIMRNTYIDSYIIGDKLQSIWGEHNIHTFLENNDLPNITIKRNTGINHVMRFHNIQFQDFVNNIIDFKKYNLPQIEKICNIENCKYKHENDIKPYNIFEIETIYANDSNDDKVTKLVEKVINYMNNEINNYNYLPNNFMFIFPILSKNYLANRLESRLQDFWINKFNDKYYQDNVLTKNTHWKDKINNNYHKYVYLHKSDEGKSINLKESENATRILSIHSSKGNGSEVVFVFGLTEYSLKKFSNNKNNLVYDSLLHVALTRQKKSLYIGIVNNGDDIYNKFNKFDIEKDIDIQPRIEDIKIHNKYQKIIDYSINTNDIFSYIDEQYIKPYNYESLIPNTDKNIIIDWGHHIIRYYVFLYYIKFNIYNNEVIENKCNPVKQFIAILNKISKLEEISTYLHKDYYEYIKENFCNIDNKNNAKEIPILIFHANEKTKYNKYKTTIIDFILCIQKKIKKSLKTNKLPLLCPLEIVILYYIIKLRDKGIYSDLTIMDIYSIIYYYDECYNLVNEHHNIYECLCKDKFIETNDNDNNNNDIYKDIRESIKNHFEKTKQIQQLYLNYKDYLNNNIDKPSNFKYNLFHLVVYGDKHDNFKITNDYVLIANSDKYVINFIITPHFNKLNFNNIIFDGIMNKYLLLNSCQKHSNYERYNNKEIITCIFTLDSLKPIFINFNVNKDDNNMKENIKSYLLTEYTSKHNIIYQFYQYCKNNKPNDLKQNSISYTYEKITKYINIPKYIEDYFYDINKEIYICKENKKSKQYIEDIFNKINNQELFLNDINNYLIKSINIFLNINEEIIDEYHDL
uniref:Competence protein CoiA nuclease-like domain-containing protein n=1 Tax=viral metagenome TaxID=1070528 RepID=A0A6C0H820_9ZZZZ